MNAPLPMPEKDENELPEGKVKITIEADAINLKIESFSGEGKLLENKMVMLQILNACQSTIIRDMRQEQIDTMKKIVTATKGLVDSKGNKL